jgi:hypothetical protein
MNRSIAMRWAFPILIAMPLLPLCGFVLNGPPEMIFFTAAMAFVLGVMLLVSLVAAVSMPPAGSPLVAKRFRFAICFASRLLCLALRCLWFQGSNARLPKEQADRVRCQSLRLGNSFGKWNPA